MFRSFCTAGLVAFALVPAAFAAKPIAVPGPGLGLDASVNGKIVTITISAYEAGTKSGPGARIALRGCNFFEMPFSMAHRTRHLSDGESLKLDKVGEFIWTVPDLPPGASPHGDASRKLVFQFRIGPRTGSQYCVDANLVQDKTNLVDDDPLTFTW